MKTIYLDHHILVDETTWPQLQKICARRDVMLLISTWTIREIVQGALRREARMDLIHGLAPRYLHDMVILQRRELRAFLSLYFFEAGLAPFAPYASSLSAFLLGSFGIAAPADYSLSAYAASVGIVDGDAVDQRKADHVDAMRLALASSREIQKLRDEIFCAKILSLILAKGNEKLMARPEELGEIMAFCLGRRDLLHRRSPAIFVEDALSAARLANPSRRPRESDTGDLYHGVLGLAYADFFVSNDRWAVACATLAKKTVSSAGLATARLLSSLSELENALQEDR